MKFFIISCLILFSVSICRAQLDSSLYKTDKEVINKIQELRDKKTDTIVCYYIDCVGAMPRLEIPDSCTSSKTKYLLWRSNSKSFIQKFDECNTYKANPMSSTFFNLIKLNFNGIKKEKIKYPAYDEIIKGKKLELSTLIDHSCHNIFEINIKGKITSKDIDDFALETKLVDDKYINKYYNRNQKSILNKLKKIVEAEVSTYNKALVH